MAHGWMTRPEGEYSIKLYCHVCKQSGSMMFYLPKSNKCCYCNNTCVYHLKRFSANGQERVVAQAGTLDGIIASARLLVGLTPKEEQENRLIFENTSTLIKS